MTTLAVAEVFGPTLQGEGPAAGQVAWFVRLGGCNLSCSWCDTPYTWDGAQYDLRQEVTHTPVGEITTRIPGNALVVLTGGEPLLQQHQPGWALLLSQLADKGCRVHVETNGTIAPDPVATALVDMFVVSPKLGNAGAHRGHQHPRLAPEWTEVAAAGRAHLKVVCVDAGDVDRTVAMATAARWPTRQVWVMPEGVTAKVLAYRWPVIADAAAGHGINATHRLHVLAWRDERGH